MRPSGTVSSAFTATVTIKVAHVILAIVYRSRECENVFQLSCSLCAVFCNVIHHAVILNDRHSDLPRTARAALLLHQKEAQFNQRKESSI